MEQLNKFLAKFLRFTPPDDAVRSATVDVVRELLGVEVRKEDISVHRGVVRVNARSALKNEIFLHHAEILSLLHSRLGNNAPTRIG